jgi:hypothetical protein
MVSPQRSCQDETETLALCKFEQVQVPAFVHTAVKQKKAGETKASYAANESTSKHDCQAVFF